MKAALAGLAFVAGCEIGIAIELMKMIHKFTIREKAIEEPIPDIDEIEADSEAEIEADSEAEIEADSEAEIEADSEAEIEAETEAEEEAE